MGNVRNVSDEDRFAVELGGRLVMPGQVIEVPDESVYGYTCQDAWEPADKATETLAKKQAKANDQANSGGPVPADATPKQAEGDSTSSDDGDAKSQED